MKIDLDVLDELVKKSFGRKFNGDQMLLYTSTDGGATLGTTDRPALIGKRYCLGFLSTAVGSFSNEEASVVVVSPEYARQAVKYVELYKQKTGQNARVELGEWNPSAERFVPLF